MLVFRVIQFIHELKKCSQTPYDKKFCDLFEKKFASKNRRKKLDADELHFITNQFEERAQKVMDTDLDYTFNSSGINQFWISLAKDLSPWVKQSYVKILFPSIVNVKDFNNGTPLTATENTYNFYIGFDGKTLFRKRGFCEHLIKKEYRLSTYRTVPTDLKRRLYAATERKLSAVTITELARIKRCSQKRAN